MDKIVRKEENLKKWKMRSNKQKIKREQKKNKRKMMYQNFNK